MRGPRDRAGYALRRGAAVLLLALGLGACGEMPDTGVEVRPAASPDAGEVPDLTNRATATIANGSLEPNLFAGEIGTAFELVITGDGAAHTLAIADLVDDFPVTATGDTTIGFTIEGEPGTSAISLDGNPAGEFERQSPSGVISD